MQDHRFLVHYRLTKTDGTFSKGIVKTLPNQCASCEAARQQTSAWLNGMFIDNKEWNSGVRKVEILNVEMVIPDR